MDWSLAISRNRNALRQIVLALFALAGLRVGGSLARLPRSVISALMLVLRPAESAVRRLIVIAARGLAVKPQAPRLAPTGFLPRSSVQNVRAFALFDPLKSFDPDDVWNVEPPKFESFFASDGTAFSSDWISVANEPVVASLIGLRLNALMRALDDLPRQARRLVRWQSRRDAALAKNQPVRLSPVRPGFPPGWRQRAIHEIDSLLRECHALALDVMNEPDTS